jgi:hypothetical protein
VHADDRPVRLLGRRAPRIVLGLLSCALGLSVTSVAAADDYKRAIEERDQTAATAAVLRKADFGALQVTGGPTKPDTSTDERCSYYNPKESDLVLTGEAESSWRGAFMEFSSDVTVLRSPQMVATDWARSFTPAPFLRCMRELAQKGLGSTGRIVSVERFAFPRIGTRTVAFRVVTDVAASSGEKVRMMVDFVIFSQGRTEALLSTTAPYAARAALHPVEIALTRKIAARLAPTA